MDLREFINEIPKSELHVHLRGAISPDVFKQIVDKYKYVNVKKLIPAKKVNEILSQPNIAAFSKKVQHCDEEDIKKLFHFSNFKEFLLTYTYVGYYIRDIDDFKLLVQGVIRNLKRQNIVYAEISVGIQAYLNNGIGLEAICEILKDMSFYCGVKINWIIAFGRTYGYSSAFKLLKKLILLKNHSIVGITLGGDETLYDPKDFQDLYRLARENELKLSVHSGEICGPDSMKKTIKYLRPNRIGHGVRSYEDQELMNYLSQKRIPLEVCLTSNICTGIFKSYKEHPFKQLLSNNIIMTINSDDPTFFSCSLTDEYLHLFNDLNVPINVIYELMQNGFKYAFLSKKEIEDYLQLMQSKWNSLISVVSSISM